MQGSLRQVAAAAVAAIAFGVSPAVAAADVRTATKADAADPTVVYDLEAVRASFDRDAGRLQTVIRFGHALPESQPTYTADSAYLSVDTCSYGTKKGDTSITLRYEDPPGADPPGYYVQHRVQFRDSYTRLPATLTPDRREVMVTIDDPLLLQGADLKCMSGSGSGRAYYDPTLPSGGPTYDSLDGERYFDGFGTPELLGPADQAATRGVAPPLEWRTGNAPDRASVAVPGQYSSKTMVMDASQPGEFTATEQYGAEKVRYRVEIGGGVTRLTLLDHISYREEYTWSVERGDGSYSVKSPQRKFTIGAPELSSLIARAKHKRGSKRTSPGSSTFTLVSTPFARFVLEVTRRGKVVKTSKGKFDEDGDAPTLRYTWSCKRTGAHKWRVTVTDEYGAERKKNGSFAVSSKPCQKPKRRKKSESPSKCHPSYPTVCIRPPPPDLDCPDVPYRDFTVRGSDPHGFDGDNDGVGCET